MSIVFRNIPTAFREAHIKTINYWLAQANELPVWNIIPREPLTSPRENTPPPSIITYITLRAESYFNFKTGGYTTFICPDNLASIKLIKEWCKKGYTMEELEWTPNL